MNFEKIRELIDVYDNSYGISEKWIQLTENNLDIRLPKVLKEYYKQLGNHPINYHQDFLLELFIDDQPSNKRLWFDENYLVFFIENQSCHFWGLKREELNKENPKVYRRENEKGSEWVMDTDNLYDFLISMALWQVTFYYDYYASRIDILNSEIKNQLSEYHLQPHVFKKWEIEFYRNNSNHLISVFRIYPDYNDKDFSHIYIMSKTKQEFDTLLEKFSISWDEIQKKEG